MENEKVKGECYYCGCPVTEENLEIEDTCSGYYVCIKPECTNNIRNETGYCSVFCQITGKCDESC